MSEITNSVALRVIEERLHDKVAGACKCLLDAGRLLCEARDGGYFRDEGSWTQWVKLHTGFSLRTAQRLMQTAREVPSGSPLESLPVTKIQALLTLPDGEARAELAERAEDMTSRELQAEVDKLRARAERAESDRETIRNKYADALCQEREKTAQAQRAHDAVAQQMEQLVNGEAERISAAAAEKAAEMTSALRDELRRAEDEAERQSEAAQRERMRAMALESMSAGQADAESAQKLLDDIRVFLGKYGAAVYSDSMRTWPRAEREALVREVLPSLSRWLDAAARLLNGADTQDAEGVVR